MEREESLLSVRLNVHELECALNLLAHEVCRAAVALVRVFVVHSCMVLGRIVTALDNQLAKRVKLAVRVAGVVHVQCGL